MKEVIKKLVRQKLSEGEIKPENFKKNRDYQDALMNQNNAKLKKMGLKNLSELSKVEGAGEYELYRGSENGNEHHGAGIYANGVHYTNDLNTARDFGDIHSFNVRLENPKIINVNEIKSLGNTSIERTDNLINLGFDSLVVKHSKNLSINGYGGYIIQLPYIEYEVIKLKNLS
jgi:hypothetical protein